MCICIGFEELAANALIELAKENRNEVTLDALNKYGDRIVKSFENQGKSAVILYSRNTIQDMLDSYGEYFELFTNDIDIRIKLKSDKTSKDLWQKFRGYLPLKAIRLFSDESVTEGLLKA